MKLEACRPCATAKLQSNETLLGILTLYDLPKILEAFRPHKAFTFT